MKKKTIILITAAVLLLAILLGGVPLLSRVVYHRSQAATMLVWQFHKNKYTTEQAFEEYLDEKRAENSLEYTLPEDAVFTVPVIRAEYDGVPMYVLNGTASPDVPVIFYFPGGSYIDQPTASQWTFADSIAADTGAQVIVPVYPKLPDHTAQEVLPALIQACGDLLRGMAYSELVFMGDSAGGGLALSLAMQLRDSGAVTPDQLILICPWADVSMTNEDIADFEKSDKLLDRGMLQHLGTLWAGGLTSDDPLVSPLYGDLSGLRSVTLFTTTGEILYPDLMLLADRLSAAEGTDCTIIVPDGTLFHTWPLYASLGIPESKTAYRQILNALAS